MYFVFARLIAPGMQSVSRRRKECDPQTHYNVPAEQTLQRSPVRISRRLSFTVKRRNAFPTRQVALMHGIQQAITLKSTEGLFAPSRLCMLPVTTALKSLVNELFKNQTLHLQDTKLQSTVSFSFCLVLFNGSNGRKQNENCVRPLNTVTVFGTCSTRGISTKNVCELQSFSSKSLKGSNHLENIGMDGGYY
jgi:hypothetical protein